ncbi:MAG TPA: EAL domain-containing protein [Acidimicrobiales bacterium]|nr:EAL domain-containing protein [Acidimicrobiales bacterium]
MAGKRKGAPGTEPGKDIRREARVVGLGDNVPTLDDVDRRRLQLWIIMATVMVSVTATMVVLSMWQEGDIETFISPFIARVGVLVIVAGFAAYAVEKELHLRRLTRLLLEERVLVTALSNRLSEMSALLEAGQAMNSVLEIDEVLSRILDNALELLGGTAGSVMLLDDGRLRAVAVRGNDHAHGTSVAMGEGIAGRVAATREPLLLDGELDERWRGRHLRVQPVQSAMSIPLVHRDTLLGVLNLNAGSGRQFSEYDLRALSLFGEHAAAAIGNARLYEVTATTAKNMTHEALHDPLTRLPNRTLFADRVAHALHRRRSRETEVAVLFLDLDDFKRVNDSWGHQVGDELLCAVAARLRAVVRDGDTACRLGGDEFAILIDEASGPGEALATADRIITALCAPFSLAGRDVAVRASIGVALSEENIPDAAELLRNADVAMYLAKDEGKACARLYRDGMHTSVLERLELESDLGRAVEQNELLLHYQPMVDLGSGRITGFEALVRWEHPTLGVLPPDRFVPLAEQSGLIVAIDRWVLLAACTQGRAWQLAHPEEAPLMVGVNLSTRQLEHDSVVDLVTLALEVSGLDPAHLVIEITESWVLQDTQAGARRLLGLHDLGVRLAIDDFGTGYASLSYLKHLPVDIIKVDRSFVEGLGQTPEDNVLVRAIIRLGETLGLEVIAEGVERLDQVEALRGLGCSTAQGWHFSHPVPVDDFSDLLVQQRAGIGCADIARQRATSASAVAD